MSDYLRPPLPAATFRDEHGAKIDYGRRWSAGLPSDAYSRVSHPERFAPLPQVAQALIDWLQDTFDVRVEQGPELAAELLLPPTGLVHAVRLTPRDATAAPLTFVFTAFPGVLLHAGALHDFPFPLCGCDACDDDVLSLIDDLEWTVRTVVAGGYTERVGKGTSSGGCYDFVLEETGVGTRSGQLPLADLPPARVQRALAALPPNGRWQPWPRRPAGVSPG